MNKPPFEISENILNLVTIITERLTRLEINIDIKKDLFLRKSSKIKSVNSSCAIEANNLNEEEVISVINGKTVLAPQYEINEVKNAYEAYTNIINYDPYKVESFLSAHKVLTTDLISESGKFRNGDVGVFDGKQVIHMGARPEYVSKLIEDLFNWAKESGLNPLIKSSVIHFEIEFIHPFNDGNGRIGRLWQSLILCKYNSIFEYEKFDTSNSLAKIKEEYLNVLTKTEKEVLRTLIIYFNKNEFIDTYTAVTILNKSKVNIRKYFGKFMKLNIMIPIGKNKGRKYRFNEKIIDKSL
ncbi:MAG: Fic family protein [Bacilli bacterium]